LTDERSPSVASGTAATGRRIIASHADVREDHAIEQTLDEGVAERGRLDIVSANAGIAGHGRAEELSEQHWRDAIAVNLTGCRAHGHGRDPPSARLRGGSIVITSSSGAIRAFPTSPTTFRPRPR
jgi:(+)-trans-carveol dehydrogenase